MRKNDLSREIIVKLRTRLLSRTGSDVYGIVLAFSDHFLVSFWKLLVLWKDQKCQEPCYGRIGPLSPGLARAANVPPETLICLRHRRIIESQDSRCSSPLLDKHSKKLTEIPVRVYEILDNEGKGKENYRPGSKWCHACKREFYSTSEAAM